MKKLLIVVVVDMQNGFITPEIHTRVLGLLESGVLATRFINSPNSIYEQLFNWKDLETKDEQEIPADYAQYIDKVIDKCVYNGINVNSLQELCQLNEGKYPDKVFLVGMDTDACVLSTAVGLFEHGIRPIVLTRYCYSGGGEEYHRAGILCMERLIGERQLLDIEIMKSSNLDIL